MNNQPIKISENCWKHTDAHGNAGYRQSLNPYSNLHREDGPAVEYANGNKSWYINGKRHRINGPAIKLANGTKFWYYNDNFIDVNSQEEFELYIKNLIFI